MKPTIFLICGPSGSGKTTVCDKIFEVDKENVSVLNEDSFYIPLLSGENPTSHNFDLPSSIDFSLMESCVEDLKNGKDAVVPIYDFVTHSRIGTKIICAKKFIVIEGILVFTREKLREYASLLIYVETNEFMCFLRRLKRDMAQRGRTFESVEKQYIEQVYPAFLEFVKPFSRYANLKLVNSTNEDYTGMDVIINMIKSNSKN